MYLLKCRIEHDEMELQREKDMKLYRQKLFKQNIMD